MAKGKSSVSIRPLGDRVLLRELRDEEKEKTTASGIIIPETVKSDTRGARKAKVVAVGEGRWDEDGEKRIPLSVKPGDIVLFNWGDELTFEDEDYYLVTESNILAVIE